MNLLLFFTFQRLYELVVRHFLACVSQPAVGAETTVEIDIAGELFSASGRVVLAVSFSAGFPILLRSLVNSILFYFFCGLVSSDVTCLLENCLYH